MRIKKECSLLLKVNVLLIFNKLPFKEEERTQKTITFICNQLKLNIMSLKYSTTTADYLRWDEMSNLVRRLSRDGDDILSLRWKDILNVDEFTLQEKKTKKNRTIRINPQLKRHIAECYDHIQPIGINSPILVSQKGTTYSIQRINVILKEIKAKYKLKVQHFSCHSLRKTFGRQVYNQNAENAELALVKLMELFNHSSVAITKRYLGLRQEEILQTYDSLSF